MPARRQKTQHLAVNATRGKYGEIRFDTAYTALEAARKATKLARAGYNVKVQPWKSVGERNVKMRCEPEKKGARTVAKCTVTPAFKKQIWGR